MVQDDEDGVAAQIRANHQDLRTDVAGLRVDLQRWTRDTNLTVARLQDEIETRRILARYARRTWFEVMTCLAIGTLLVGDLADRYATNGWWGLLFWTTRHGSNGTGEIIGRSIGFAWQAAVLLMLRQRSQVPRMLVSRLAANAPSRFDLAP